MDQQDCQMVVLKHLAELKKSPTKKELYDFLNNTLSNNTFSKTLGNLTRRGLVEGYRDGKITSLNGRKIHRYRYRITSAGRQKLAKGKEAKKTYKRRDKNQCLRYFVDPKALSNGVPADKLEKKNITVLETWG